MSKWKAIARKLVPRLYSAVDEAPSFQAELPEGAQAQFSGWAFHSHHLVVLELEIQGEILDRFYPSKTRLDVLSAHSNHQHALYSGFERAYSYEVLQSIEQYGATLYACTTSQRTAIWEHAPVRIPEEEEKEKLQSLFPPLFSPPSPSKTVHLVLGYGEIEHDDEFLKTVLILQKEHHLALHQICIPHRAPIAQLQQDFPEISLTPFDPSAPWESLQSLGVAPEEMILFISRPVEMTQLALRKLFEIKECYQEVPIVAPASKQQCDAETHFSQKPTVAGASVFDEVWIATFQYLLQTVGSQEIESPCIRQRFYAAQPAVGLYALHAPYRYYSAAPDFLQKERAGSTPLCICLPYRALLQPDRDKQFAPLLSSLQKAPQFDPFFLCHDTHYQQPSLDGIPIFRASEIASCKPCPELIVLATDSWSERFGRLLRYTLEAKELYRVSGWKTDTISYPELHAPSLWAKRNPLAELRGSDIVTDKVLEKRTKDEIASAEPNAGISCIVPIYNSLSSVLSCVRSLLLAQQEGDEIVLVNDCSDAGTTEALKRLQQCFPTLQILHHPINGGFIEACYSGLDRAKEENDILLVNSDVVLSSETLEQLRKALLARPETALFSPFSTGSRKLQLDPAPGETLNTLASRLAAEHSPSYPTVVTPEGQCLLIRRTAIKELDFFDRVYGKGFSEESDLAMRYFLYGEGMCVVDNALVFHEQSASFGDTQRKQYLSRNRPIFNARWQLEYEAAFAKYTADGLVQKIQTQMSSNDDGGTDRPLDVDSYLEKVEKERNSPPTVLSSPRWLEEAEVIFLLPNIAGSGGSLSVLQHVNEMLLQGIEARIAYLGRNTLPSFPLLTRPVRLDLSDALNFTWKKGQALIATHWSTAYLVRAIIERHEGMLGYYYVQDYEPWFYKTNHPHYAKAADTYSFPLQKVAKTTFLAETVMKIHREMVLKVSPGLDRGVFYPNGTKTMEGAPKFVAMYRPSTARRAPDRLLRFFSCLLERCPEAEIVLFGDDVEGLGELRERITSYGKISRKKVAELYREAHFVVDLSLFHGFGRMGLEGMSCGAVPVLSSSGGVSEYASSGENCLMGDGENVEQLVTSVMAICGDPEIYRALQENALRTSERYSECRATGDWLKLLELSPREQEISPQFHTFFHRDSELDSPFLAERVAENR